MFNNEVLLYDTTNFFTYFSRQNTRSELSKRGHSKAKRHDLRQVGLALLVTRDFRIPLFHRVYPGNIPDVSLFPEIARELISRHKKLFESKVEGTLVFDRGNVSEDGMERLIASGHHFVAAVPFNRLPELFSKSSDQFEDISGHPGVQAYTEDVLIWGKKCRGIVLYTESFFTKQLDGVTGNLVKCQQKLSELEKSLIRWRQGKGRGKHPTVNSVKTTVKEILAPQFMKKLFNCKIAEENGLPRMFYSVNHDRLNELIDNRLGRTLLITDQNEWTAKEVLEAYRSLSYIEDTFKDMKNTDFLRWQPAYHWTDQKLKVHGFYCVLALLLASLARKIASQHGTELTIPKLLKELTGIREVAVIYPKGTLAHKKDHVALTRMSSKQKKLAVCLEIANFLGR